MSTHCPFCNIASTYPPVSPSVIHHQPHNQPEPTTVTTSPPTSDPAPLQTGTDKNTSSSHAFLILSTKHVLAFLDIMPLTKGHVLVVTRDHHETLGDVGVEVGRELGQWLPILSRVVTRSLFGSEKGDAHWNVVQNNGVRAAQVVPHVHFHIIPRPPVDQSSNTATRPSYIMFGRGQRDELDEEEGEVLAGMIRGEVDREVSRVRDIEGIDLGDFGPKRKGGKL